MNRIDLMYGDRFGWIRKIKVGDILVEGNTPRVVRYVKHGTQRTYVALSIRRCSWTTRCYTILTTSDLKTRRFRPTSKRQRLTKKIDRQIANAINETKIYLTCCDIEGIG